MVDDIAVRDIAHPQITFGRLPLSWTEVCNGRFIDLQLGVLLLPLAHELVERFQGVRG